MKNTTILIVIGLLSVMNLYGQSYSLNTPINQLKAAAEANNAEAQFWLGQAYFQGENVQKNETKGFQWMVLAANQGYTKAQAAVGECYLYGEGTTQNENKGIEWLKKAADQGYQMANFVLGMYYLYDADVASPGVHAQNYLKDAVENKLEIVSISPNGEEYNLVKYYYGCAWAWCLAYYIPDTIDEYDIEEPTTDNECLKLSAKYGDSLSQYAIGKIYLKHENYNEAFKWLKKAADNDEPMAKYDLGVMYYKGKGVTKNTQTAIKWWKEAASDGEPYAKEALRKLNIEY